MADFSDTAILDYAPPLSSVGSPADGTGLTDPALGTGATQESLGYAIVAQTQNNPQASLGQAIVTQTQNDPQQALGNAIVFDTQQNASVGSTSPSVLDSLTKAAAKAATRSALAGYNFFSATPVGQVGKALAGPPGTSASQPPGPRKNFSLFGSPQVNVGAGAILAGAAVLYGLYLLVRR